MDAVGVDRQQQRSDKTCPRNNGTTTNSRTTTSHTTTDGTTNGPRNNQRHHQRHRHHQHNRTCVDSPCVVPTATTVRGVEVERPSVRFV